MNDITTALKDAFEERTANLVLPRGLARRSLVDARRARCMQQASGSVAVAALGAGAAAVVALYGPPHGDGVRPGAPPPAACTWLSPPPRFVQPGAPAALTAVSLPDPAPGFPVRRLPGSVARVHEPDGEYWEAIFLVGQAAERQGCNVSSEPGASVIVMYGAPAPQPDAQGKIDGSRVVGKVVAQGHPAYITHETNDDGSIQIALHFSSGQFSIVIAGGGASVDQLVTLGNAIQNLT